ncbi:unnamed protein product, partial [Vitis vinifera]
MLILLKLIRPPYLISFWHLGTIEQNAPGAFLATFFSPYFLLIGRTPVATFITIRLRSLTRPGKEAANYLNIKSLLDLTCQTVADMIKGKTPEEIRKTFNIKNDFTPEEEEEVRRENQWAFE